MMSSALSLEVGEGQQPSPAQIVEARNRYMKWCNGCRKFQSEKDFGKRPDGRLQSQCRVHRARKHKDYQTSGNGAVRKAANQAKRVTGPVAERIKKEESRQRFIEKQLRARNVVLKPETRGRPLRAKPTRIYIKSRPPPEVCEAEWSLGNHWCSTCRAFRPRSEFTKCGTTKHKLQNRCRNHTAKRLDKPANASLASKDVP